MRHEEIICEQPTGTEWSVAPIFVTVLVAREAQGQLTREHHVFLPAEERHLHAITYTKLEEEIDEATRNDAVEATREMLADHLMARGALALQHPRMAPWNGPKRTTPSPFHHFRIARLFLREMAEIQEWTASRQLREVLARLDTYQVDPEEASLLAWVFAPAASADIGPV